jgi:hypothetical protein
MGFVHHQECFVAPLDFNQPVDQGNPIHAVQSLDHNENPLKLWPNFKQNLFKLRRIIVWKRPRAAPDN